MSGFFAFLASNKAITLPKIDYSAIAPELILIGAALVIMLISSMTSKRNLTTPYSILGLMASTGSGLWSLHLYGEVRSHGASSVLAGALIKDGFSSLFLTLISLCLVLSILVGEGVIFKVGSKGPDFVSLLLLSGSGAMFMASAGDLIVIFLGLEIMSIALYILVAFSLSRVESREGAFKYFILGGFSSALFLYGIALTYGATGSTNLVQIASFLTSNLVTHDGVFLAGMALLLVGFAFKISAVPFHFWTPDVYQGAPTTITGYMAAVAKAGAFAGFIRVFIVAFSTHRLDWRPIVLVMVVASTVLGAVLAIAQSDVKRMLAYSSINHVGFILLGLYVGTTASVSDALYYLFVYAVMAIGTFGALSLCGADGGEWEGPVSIRSLRGLSRRRPFLAIMLAVFLMAQAGAPFTTGFLAKFSVLSAAITNKDYVLAILVMLSAVVAVFFYLRVAFAIYGPVDIEGATSLSESGGSTAPIYGQLETATLQQVKAPALPIFAVWGVVLSFLFTIGFGIISNPLLSFAQHATLGL